MACGNNNNRGGNLGGLKNILDFNVTYTGCETSCGGREIKTGDSLRNVLDALVANCDGGSGPSTSSTNFWFSRNVPTFTVDVKENDFALTGAGAIYEFVDGEWQNTGIQIGGGSGGGGTWGSITGEIADQTDLTEYINLLITEAPVSLDKFGENFHKKDGDEKVQLGRVVAGLPDGPNYVHIGLNDISFPQDIQRPGFLIIGSDQDETMYIGSLGSLGINSVTSLGINSSDGSINIIATSGAATLAARGRVELSSENDIVAIDSRNGDVILNSPNGRVISDPITIQDFPTSPESNIAATVGYVTSMINALQTTIDGQATQISDLTARIEALENA